jgi:hypothetical protein
LRSMPRTLVVALILLLRLLQITILDCRLKVLMIAATTHATSAKCAPSIVCCVRITLVLLILRQISHRKTYLQASEMKLGRPVSSRLL